MQNRKTSKDDQKRMRKKGNASKDPIPRSSAEDRNGTVICNRFIDFSYNNRIICYTIPSRKGGELNIKKGNKIKICSNSTLARNLVHVLSSLRCALQHTILLPPPSSLAVIFHGEWVCLTDSLPCYKGSLVWQRECLGAQIASPSFHRVQTRTVVAAIRSAQH